MIPVSDRYVAGEVLSWTAAVCIAGAGLAFAMTAVESARWGPGQALLRAALAVPALIVPLIPLLSGVGAALAAARLEARRERTALEALGLAPARTARAAAAVGVLVGGIGWLSAGYLVPLVEAHALARREAAASGWVWLDGEAVRLPDGLAVAAAGGEIGRVRLLPQAERRSEALAHAAALRTPRTASAAALRSSSLPPAQVERHARLARVAGSGLLALLGWLPLARLPRRQVALVAGLGLAWQLGDFLLQALAAQGRLPVEVGAWAGVAMLAAGVHARLCLPR